MADSSHHESPAQTGENHNSSEAAESHLHPIGTSVGAVLAASTAGATCGAFAGPVGAIIGAVVGAVAGGLSGQAIAELVEQGMPVVPGTDEYASRVHPHSSSDTEEDTKEDDDSHPDTGQTRRESWSMLDQSSKEILTGDSDPPND